MYEWPSLQSVAVGWFHKKSYANPVCNPSKPLSKGRRPREAVRKETREQKSCEPDSSLKISTIMFSTNKEQGNNFFPQSLQTKIQLVPTFLPPSLGLFLFLNVPVYPF